MPRHRIRPTLVGVAAVTSLAAACSSATDPKSNAANGLSANEAGALATAFVSQVFAAVGSATNLNRSASTIVFSRAPQSRAPQASAPLAGVSGAPRLDLSAMSFTQNCPLGGTVAGTAGFTSTLDANGTGSIASAVTVTPQACVVSAGDRNLAVTGAPSIAMAVSVPLTAYAQSGTAVFRITGGFSWSGGTCQLDYAANVTAAGHGSVAGTVCGQSISQSF